MSYPTDYEDIDGGYVAFGGNPKGGKITRKGSGPDWLFDIDALTKIINYEPIVASTHSNGFASTKASDNASQARNETKLVKCYILLPLWTTDPLFSQDPKSSHDDGSKPSSDDGKKEEPKKVIHTLKDLSWMEAMQEELLQFKLQKVWSLLDLPNGKKAIGTKWVFRNKKDKIRRNKARFVAQGNTQEEGIDYDKVFAPVARIKKFGFTEVKTASTPMKTQKPLLKDKDGEKVDVYMYMSMIGLLMYLTSSRPDIMFVMCTCARYQVNPKVSHLHAVKRIFSDYAEASLERKSTIGGCQFLGCRLISSQCKKQIVVANSTTKAEYVAASNKAVHKELGDSLVRAATTVSSLEAEQDNDNINNTQSKATPNESSSQGTDSGGGPRCQEAMGDTTAQTRLKLNELMELCTNLQTRVLDLEKTKTTQSNEVASLKRRVKKLIKRNRSRTHKLKRLYKVGLTARVESSEDEESLGEDASKQGRIEAIDADEDITIVNVQDDADIFNANELGGEEVFVAEQEVVKDVNANVVEEVVNAA
nr:hypothetical protein [Tanacetum cinerariifolium]